MNKKSLQIAVTALILHWCLPSTADDGFDFEAVYTGEVFRRVRGGRKHGPSAAYLGNVDLLLELDSEKMGWWRGGTFFLYGQNNHGRGISPETGVFDAHSYLEPDAPFTQLSEFWYRQEFLEGRLAFKTGKIDANVDFAATETGGYFIQSAAGAFPTLIIPTFPDPGLGVAVFTEPADFVTLQMGIFDDATAREALPAETSSFLGLSGETVSYAELQLRADRLTDGLPGTVRVGGWYDTASFQ